MNSAFGDAFSRPSVFWHDTSADISVECETVAIRPYIPFLVKSKINGLMPFDDFDDFLAGIHRYDFHAKYHKCCINAYFHGDFQSLDHPTVRKYIACYVDYLDIRNEKAVPQVRLKEDGLPQSFKSRPESAVDIYCLHRHCRFQAEPKSLRNFGDELKVPLYVEIMDDKQIQEFPPDVPNEGVDRIRMWSIIPKRSIARVQAVTIQMSNGKFIKVAKIGGDDGDMQQASCFWLTGHKDSVHLFQPGEITRFRCSLEHTAMIQYKKFASKLTPSYRPTEEDIRAIEDLLGQLKMGVILHDPNETASLIENSDEYEYDDFLADIHVQRVEVSNLQSTNYRLSTPRSAQHNRSMDKTAPDVSNGTASGGDGPSDTERDYTEATAPQAQRDRLLTLQAAELPEPMVTTTMEQHIGNIDYASPDSEHGMASIEVSIGTASGGIGPNEAERDYMKGTTPQAPRDRHLTPPAVKLSEPMLTATMEQHIDNIDYSATESENGLTSIEVSIGTASGGIGPNETKRDYMKATTTQAHRDLLSTPPTAELSEPMITVTIEQHNANIDYAATELERGMASIELSVGIVSGGIGLNEAERDYMEATTELPESMMTATIGLHNGNLSRADPDTEDGLVSFEVSMGTASVRIGPTEAERDYMPQAHPYRLLTPPAAKLSEPMHYAAHESESHPASIDVSVVPASGEVGPTKAERDYMDAAIPPSTESPNPEHALAPLYSSNGTAFGSFNGAPMGSSGTGHVEQDIMATSTSRVSFPISESNQSLMSVMESPDGEHNDSERTGALISKRFLVPRAVKFNSTDDDITANSDKSIASIQFDSSFESDTESIPPNPKKETLIAGEHIHINRGQEFLMGDPLVRRALQYNMSIGSSAGSNQSNTDNSNESTPNLIRPRPSIQLPEHTMETGQLDLSNAAEPNTSVSRGTQTKKRPMRIRHEPSRLHYYRRSYERLLAKEAKRKHEWIKNKTRRYSSLRH